MNIKLDAKLRKTGKKSLNKQARKDGLIPAIIYSAGKEGVLINLDRAVFKQQYKKSIGEVAFFDINVNNEHYTTIMKDRQIHPVSREFVHIDFLELHAGQEITLNIPITYTGDSPGVAAGGNLDILHREMEITCLPKDIPEEIVVNLEKLTLGEAIHFGDIEIPENISTSFSDETALVTVNLPREEEEETEEAEETEIEIGEEETEKAAE